MIQRIQSVLMLLASGVLGLEFAFPFASSNSISDGYFADGVFNIFDNNIILVLISVGIVVSIAAIFLFKNRKLQTSLNWLSILLCISSLVASYFLLSQNQSSDLNGINIGAGAFLPVISMILLFVANRFINKDENLVKSMDRLR